MCLKVIVVDDIDSSRRGLVSKLQEEGCIVVAELKNGEEGLAWWDKNDKSIDAIFTDIRMPGLDGLQMVEAMKDRPSVVFCTMYEEHAVRAFKLAAVHYLVRPISNSDIRDTVRRIQNKMVPTISNETARRLAAPEDMWIPVRGHHDGLLLISDITHLELRNKNVIAHKKSRGEVITDWPNLERAVQYVEDFGIIQISRWHAVNISSIDSFSLDNCEKAWVKVGDSQLNVGSAFVSSARVLIRQHRKRHPESAPALST